MNTKNETKVIENSNYFDFVLKIAKMPKVSYQQNNCSAWKLTKMKVIFIRVGFAWTKTKFKLLYVLIILEI